MNKPFAWFVLALFIWTLIVWSGTSSLQPRKPSAHYSLLSTKMFSAETSMPFELQSYTPQASELTGGSLNPQVRVEEIRRDGLLKATWILARENWRSRNSWERELEKRRREREELLVDWTYLTLLTHSRFIGFTIWAMGTIIMASVCFWIHRNQKPYVPIATTWIAGLLMMLISSIYYSGSNSTVGFEEIIESLTSEPAAAPQINFPENFGLISE